jgi:predicted Zn-dependent peptidase
MLRQQTGLFYTGYGELTNGAFDVQGKIFIRCLVSNEKIDDVKKMFLQEIDHAIDSLTDAQLQEAKNNIYNNFDLLYDKNDAIASALENLYRLHLPFDFYNQQIAAVQKITKEQVVAAVKKYLASDKMICIQAGRTGDLQLPQA